jgi:hypothetical protein
MKLTVFHLNVSCRRHSDICRQRQTGSHTAGKVLSDIRPAQQEKGRVSAPLLRSLDQSTDRFTEKA